MRLVARDLVPDAESQQRLPQRRVVGQRPGGQLCGQFLGDLQRFPPARGLLEGDHLEVSGAGRVRCIGEGPLAGIVGLIALAEGAVAGRDKRLDAPGERRIGRDLGPDALPELERLEPALLRHRHHRLGPEDRHRVLAEDRQRFGDQRAELIDPPKIGQADEELDPIDRVGGIRSVGIAVDGDDAIPVPSLASQEGLRGDDWFGIWGILERPGEELLDPVETLPDHRHLKLEEGHLLVVGGKRPGLLHRLGGFVDLPVPHLPGGHDLPRGHVVGRQFDHPLHDPRRRLRVAAVLLENPGEVGEGLRMAGGRLEGWVELFRPLVEAGEGGEDRLGLVELPGARSHRRIEQVDAKGVVVGLAAGAPVSNHGEVVAGGVGVPRPGQERCQFFAEVVFLGVSPDRHFEGRERRADGAGGGLARIDLPEEDFGILALPRGVVRPEGDVPP